MSNDTALAVIPKETALTVFTTEKGLDPFLAKVRAELDSFVPDVTTKKGREAIASMAYKVSQVKSYLETVGKELADAQKEIPKKIDATRKSTRETLDQWRDEVRKPLTDWEEAEQARIARLTAAVTSLQTIAADRSMRTPQQIRDQISTVDSCLIAQDVFAEYFALATQAKAAATESLSTALADAEKRERDAAELEELRKAAAEKAAKDREEQIAKEAAEKAKAEAERVAKLAAEEAERKAKDELAAAAKREQDAKDAAIKAKDEAEQKAREEAERVAKREQELKDQAAAAERQANEAKERAERAEADAKAKAERDQLEKEAAEKAAADKREADVQHRAKINNAALAAFVSGGLSKDMAKLAVELIARRTIPAVWIEY